MPNFEFIQKYIDANLISRSGMAFWHSVVPAETDNDVIYDYSGNERHVTTANAGEAINNPVVQGDVLDGKPATYFDGTDSPLAYVDQTMFLNHVFVLAKYDGATFDPGENGLMSDATGDSSLLLGQGSGQTKFYDLGYDVSGYTYRKNDVEYAENAQAAPMNSWGLMELRFPSAIECEGIQYGRDRVNGLRRWKGWLIDGMGFTSLRTEAQRAQILAYYKLKYPSLDIPLVFPTPSILPVHGSSYYSHFRETEVDYDSITIYHEYDDGGRSFNETSDTATRRWDLEIEGVSYAQARIYDEFRAQARKANTFSFTDKFGAVHTGVRIEDYSRTHSKNRSWLNDVKFTLVKYP
jgi:hypothetical protein